METFYRPTWVEVSLDALRHNIRAFRQALPAEMKVMAVVKADGYGHGAVKVAQEAMECGVSYIGVAFLDEALELRREGVKAPILVLGYTQPEGIPLAIEHDITLTVFQDELWAALEERLQAASGPTAEEGISWLEKGPEGSAHAAIEASVQQGSPSSMRGPQSRAGCHPTNVITTDATTNMVSKPETAAVSESMSTDAFTSTSESIHANDIDTNMTATASTAATTATPRKLKVHIKIDTGMGRLGLQPNDEAISYITCAVEHPLLDVEGVYTHFACADEADKAYTLEQHRKFERIIRHLEERGVTFRFVHTGNSAAGIDCPELSYSMVRLGIGMYGLYPSEEVNKERVQLEPVMSIKTRAVHVKTLPAGSGISYGTTYHTSGEECIATLPIGYADGYSRMLSGKAQAIVRGRKVPIVGRICMDQCMANVSGLGDLSKAEEVVLMGRQQDEAITAEDLAALLGTVNYEITCMVSHRVPRVYIRDGRREDVLNPLIR